MTKTEPAPASSPQGSRELIAEVTVYLFNETAWNDVTHDGLDSNGGRSYEVFATLVGCNSHDHSYEAVMGCLSSRTFPWKFTIAYPTERDGVTPALTLVAKKVLPEQESGVKAGDAVTYTTWGPSPRWPEWKVPRCDAPDAMGPGKGACTCFDCSQPNCDKGSLGGYKLG